MATRMLESYSPLRVLSIFVSYPNFNSPSEPSPSFLHDGDAFALQKVQRQDKVVQKIKSEDSGYDLGSFVVLRRWLSGEAAFSQACSLSFVLVLGGELGVDAGHFVRIPRRIGAASLTVSIGDECSAMAW